MPKCSPSKCSPLKSSLNPLFAQCATDANSDYVSTTQTEHFTPSISVPVKSSMTGSSLVIGNSLHGNGEDQSSRGVGGRLTALARRQQQMQQWDDDYTYHSSYSSSQGVKVSNTVTTSSKHANPSQHDVPSKYEVPSKYGLISEHGSPKHAIPSKLDSQNNAMFSKYTSNSSTACFSPVSSSSDSLMCTLQSSPNLQSSNAAARSGSVATSKYIFGEVPAMSPDRKRDLEFSTHKPRADNACHAADGGQELPAVGMTCARDQSPTAKMFWDRQLINSLVSYFYSLYNACRGY